MIRETLGNKLHKMKKKYIFKKEMNYSNKFTKIIKIIMKLVRYKFIYKNKKTFRIK